jgi:hypothetical protein
VKILSFIFLSALLLYGIGGLIFYGYYLLYPDYVASLSLPWQEDEESRNSFRSSDEDDLLEINALYYTHSERTQDARSMTIDKLIDKSERYHREMVVFEGEITILDTFAIVPTLEEIEVDVEGMDTEEDISPDDSEQTGLEFIGMEVRSNSEEVLVVYRGPDDLLSAGDYIEVTGVVNDQPTGVVATQIIIKEIPNPIIDFMDGNIFYLTLSTMMWMILVIMYYLVRARKVRRMRGLPVAMILFSFLLSSCEIHYVTEIKADGSAVISTSFIESSENVDFLEQVPLVRDMYESWKMQMLVEGGSMDHSSAGEIDQFFFQRHVEDFEQSIGMLSSVDEREQWIFFDRATYGEYEALRYEGFINTPMLLDIDPDLGSTVVNEMQSEIINIYFDYSVILPGEIVYHNADVEDGNSLTWVIPIEDGRYVVAVALIERQVVADQVSMPISVYQILFGVCIVFLIFLLISLIFFRPKRFEREQENL